MQINSQYSIALQIEHLKAGQSGKGRLLDNFNLIVLQCQIDQLALPEEVICAQCAQLIVA